MYEGVIVLSFAVCDLDVYSVVFTVLYILLNESIHCSVLVLLLVYLQVVYITCIRLLCSVEKFQKKFSKCHLMF